MSKSFIVTALSLLLGLQPLTTDLYLPALPTITEIFNGSMGQAQLTLSALLLAFGSSQLIWGPISDRFGRRPVLLFGLALYCLAAIGSALVSSMEILIAWRVLQGAAMGASVMCARTLVRDLFDNPIAGAKLMSQGLTGLGFLACISTPLGGLLTDLFGWRVALMFLAVVGATLLFILFFWLEETLKQTNPDSLKSDNILKTWSHILRNYTFWGFSLLQAGTYTGLFVFLINSSFVFIKILNISPTVYGLLMFSISASFIIGTIVCRRLLLIFTISKTIAIGGAISLTGGTLLIIFTVLDFQGLMSIMIPIYLFILAHGINQPCSQSSVMGPFPHAAGAASALSSFIMVIVTFVVGYILGLFMGNSIYPMVLGIWYCSIFIAFVAWVVVPHTERKSSRSNLNPPISFR